MHLSGGSGRHVETGGDDGEEFAGAVAGDEAAGMGGLVDLEQWRRARRLLPILVDRHGLAFFLDDTTSFPALPAFSPTRLARCVAVAADWIEARSGRPVDEQGRASLLAQLRGILRERLHAGVVVSHR